MFVPTMMEEALVDKGSKQHPGSGVVERMQQGLMGSGNALSVACSRVAWIAV
jgi:hypothetical protein